MIITPTFLLSDLHLNVWSFAFTIIPSPSWQSQWLLFKLPRSIALTYYLSQCYVLCIPPPPPPYLLPLSSLPLLPPISSPHTRLHTWQPIIVLAPTDPEFSPSLIHILVFVKINHQFLQKNKTKTTFGEDPKLYQPKCGQRFQDHLIMKIICFKFTWSEPSTTECRGDEFNPTIIQV